MIIRKNGHCNKHFVLITSIDECFVRQALEKSKGNQTHVAKLLGISRHSLIYRMDKYILIEKFNVYDE